MAVDEECWAQSNTTSLRSSLPFVCSMVGGRSQRLTEKTEGLRRKPTDTFSVFLSELVTKAKYLAKKQREDI